MAKQSGSSGKPMRFTSLRLSSWKNFKKVEVPLSDRVFVIGPNASGKSNFLEVFRFLHDLATEGGGLAKAVSLREGMSKLRSLHATVNSAVVIDADLEDAEGTQWSYRLEFDTPSRSSTDALVKSERVERDGVVLLDRPDLADKGDNERLKQTAVEQVSANVLFRPLAELFRSIRFMNLVPQLIREGQLSPGVFPGQDPLGRDFLEQIRLATKGRKGRLDRIGKELRKAVPSFEKLRLATDARGRPHLEVGFKHWRTTAAKQRESQFSDGTLRLIAMLWALQDNAGPLLLEEPEWSLHTGILERLAPMIAGMQRTGGGRQVIITTHSEKLLSDPGIAPEEILLITPAVKGGSEIKPAARFPVIEKAMRSGLSAGLAAQPLTRIESMSLFGDAR